MVKPKYPVVPAPAAAPALSCRPKNEPVAVFPPDTPELPAEVPNVPRPVIGDAGEPVELVLVGTATLDAYAVPVAVLVAIEYFVWFVPKMVKTVVSADDAAGFHCQNFKFETVNATELVHQPFNHIGKEAEPALTGLAVYVVVPVLSAVSKSQDIAAALDVAVIPVPAGVVLAPELPVAWNHENVAAIHNHSPN